MHPPVFFWTHTALELEVAVEAGNGLETHVGADLQDAAVSGHQQFLCAKNGCADDVVIWCNPHNARKLLAKI